MLTLSNQTKGSLAEPGADYVDVSGSLTLEEGETSVAINITILEVSTKPFQIYCDLYDIRTGIFWNLQLAAYVLVEGIHVSVMQNDVILMLKITGGQIITKRSATSA